MPRVRKPKTKSATASEVVVDGMAEVVSLEEKKAKKEKKSDSKLTDFYQKYPHVVKNSVRDVAKGEEVDRGELLPTLVSKGKLCTVECLDCQTTFEVNVQDAFQSKRCPRCKRNAVKERRAQRKQARAAKQATG